MCVWTCIARAARSANALPFEAFKNAVCFAHVRIPADGQTRTAGKWLTHTTRTATALLGCVGGTLTGLPVRYGDGVHSPDEGMSA